jgi:hypothetical protein
MLLCASPKGKRDMDFLVERPLAEVMIQAEKYMVVQQGFNRTLDSTETRQSFFRKREGIANIAEAIGLVDGAWVRFVAAEGSEGNTRLSVTASTVDLERGLERWVTTELGGTPSIS